MKKSFTLLELVVVIIILGVLATLGLTQYGSMVERGRIGEAIANLGDMRKLAIAYRLANGSVTGMANADVNIGTAADQLPNWPNCRSTHYFTYFIDTAQADPVVRGIAVRCTSGGKPPQGSGQYELNLWTNLVTGEDTKQRWDPGIGYHGGW